MYFVGSYFAITGNGFSLSDNQSDMLTKTKNESLCLQSYGYPTPPSTGVPINVLKLRAWLRLSKAEKLVQHARLFCCGIS